MPSVIVVANRTMWSVSLNKETGELAEGRPTAGGLVTATCRLGLEKNGRVIGWPGGNYGDPDASDDIRQTVADILDKNNTTPVHLSIKEYQAHYLNFANQVLWPLFHADSPALAATFRDKAGWVADEEADVIAFASRYYAVNPLKDKEEPVAFTTYWQPREQVLADSNISRNVIQYFSKAIINELHQDRKNNSESAAKGLTPLVWVHDYQLMFLCDRLRKDIKLDNDLQNKYIPMGFFCHIPFSHPDRWRDALSHGLPFNDLRDLLLGPLGADLIGFHTQKYCDNFLDSLIEFKDYLPEIKINKAAGKIEYDGRIIEVKPFPIGIDYAIYTSPEEAAQRKLDVPQPEKASEATRVKREKHMKEFENFHGKDSKVILSVERLDPIKGIVEKLKAFERLLHLHPELIDKVSYECIVVPSRSGARINDELDVEIKEIVNRINSNKKYRTERFPDGPVHFVPDSRDTAVLCEYYRRSHVINTASMADGMNLTAMEYVAARQEGTGGRVILSPLMGVTNHFDAYQGQNHYLIVDPNKMGDDALNIYAEMLHHAILTCDSPSAEESMQILKNIVARHSNVHNWAEGYLSTAVKVADHNAVSQNAQQKNTITARSRSASSMSVPSYSASPYYAASAYCSSMVSHYPSSSGVYGQFSPPHLFPVQRVFPTPTSSSVSSTYLSQRVVNATASYPTTPHSTTSSYSNASYSSANSPYSSMPPSPLIQPGSVQLTFTHSGALYIAFEDTSNHNTRTHTRHNTSNNSLYNSNNNSTPNNNHGNGSSAVTRLSIVPLYGATVLEKPLSPRGHVVSKMSINNNGSDNSSNNHSNRSSVRNEQSHSLSETNHAPRLGNKKD